MESEPTAALLPKSWEAAASGYNAFERKWNHYAKVAERLVRPLAVQSDAKVLELASGTGACTGVVAQLCPRGKVVCVERSKSMLAIAEANARSARLTNVSFVEGDVLQLPELLAGFGPFDSVVCNSAIFLFQDPLAVVRGVKRVLKPGGLFAFNVPWWYPSSGRMTVKQNVQRIVTRAIVDASVWEAARLEPSDYRRVVREAGMQMVEDTSYEVAMTPEEKKDLARVPLFSQLFSRPAGFRPLALVLVRRVIGRNGLLSLSPGSKYTSGWNLFVAKA